MTFRNMHFKIHTKYKLKFYIIKFDRYATIPSSYCKLLTAYSYFLYVPTADY